MERSSSTTLRQDVSASVWWILLIQGVVLAVFGLWLLANPGLTVLVLVQILGAYWFVVGAIDLIELFSGNTKQSKVWLAVSGIVGIIAGILALNNPLMATFITITTLTFFIGLAGLIIGISGIVRGLSGGGLDTFVLGLISTAISLYILLNPSASAAALPLAIGSFALVGGVMLVISSLGHRSQSRWAF